MNRGAILILIEGWCYLGRDTLLGPQPQHQHLLQPANRQTHIISDNKSI